jgi:hypothetical protein
MILLRYVGGLQECKLASHPLGMVASSQSAALRVPSQVLSLN